MTRERPSAKRRTKLLSEQMDVDKADERMRQQAACVLEVLAGLRSPEEAAKVIGVSVPTYYNLEARALRGLLHGCQAESAGRRMAVEKRLAESEQRAAELERQLQRYRSVLRNARRAARILGGGGDESSSAGPESGASRRKPRVRAKRAIEALGGSGGPAPGPGSGGSP